jgi:hypothetical protein
MCTQVERTKPPHKGSVDLQENLPIRGAIYQPPYSKHDGALDPSFVPEALADGYGPPRHSF